MGFHTPLKHGSGRLRTAEQAVQSAQNLSAAKRWTLNSDCSADSNTNSINLDRLKMLLNLISVQTNDVINFAD